MSGLFGNISPELYDLSLPYVVPGVEEAQRIRQVAFRKSLNLASGSLTGLEVGIGTGVDASRLIPPEVKGRLVGLDESSGLTKKLREVGRLPYDRPDCGPSLELVIADFSDPSAYSALSALVPHGFDYATSAFAVHNVPSDRQAVAFENIARCLKPGSPFFYLDLVTFDDQSLREEADRVDADFIRQEMAQTPSGVDPAEWSELREAWLKHYRDENFLVPLDSESQPSLYATLKRAGFKRTELLYRYWNTTLLVAWT